MTYRKIGGIHWFRIGRWRISICRTKPANAKLRKALREAGATTH